MAVQKPFQRHWSFVVCDKKYIYPFVLILLGFGLWMAFQFRDANHFSRIGNFIIGAGVWISMRSTLRAAFNKNGSDLNDLSPTIPGTNGYYQLNPTFFNNLSFSAGDQRLQIHGFILVVVGSLIGSYGDLLLKTVCRGVFK